MPESTYQFLYPEYSESLYFALKDDAFCATVAGRAVESKSAEIALRCYFDYSIVEGKKYGLSFFPKSHKYGVSVWLKPLDADLEARKKKEKLEFIREQMGEASAQVYTNIVEYMSAQSAAFVVASSWYLSIVGILPEFQNRGLGETLVSEVLKETDRLGVSTYLETFTPRNENFYTRLGYQVAGSFHEPTIGARYSIMTRTCRGKK